MGISAKEAAEITGMSKNAIFKAIKTGKLSAEKNIHGEWKIEPAELFRVYPPVNDSSRTTPQPSSREDTPQAIEGLQRENELLREMVADLRNRLDAEADERRKEAEERRKLTFILTDKQHEVKESQKQGFWAWLFG